MEPMLFLQYARIALREMAARKWRVLTGFCLISFGVLMAGIFWPSSYHTAITIYADNHNIIKPLLEKKTSMTAVKQDRIQVVRDLIYSPRTLRKVVADIYGADVLRDVAETERLITAIRERIEVKGLSGNYIKISYFDKSPELAYRIIGKIVSLFIEDSARTKQDESKNAFRFIDEQVRAYKEQLIAAENELKEFSAANVDGSEAAVAQRVSKLRSQIEEINIAIDEQRTRIFTLESQLRQENQYSNSDFRLAAYHEQLRELEASLATMLLSYKEDYPGVVDLRYQIDDVRTAIKRHGDEKKGVTVIDSEFNPLYVELRSKLADARVQLQGQRNRLGAYEKLLALEYERRKQIAANQARLAELTRDYAVTQKLYEGMLESKEKARLSMVLDIAGQGINYKIQEAAQYPLLPEGPRFLHFVVAGPILGVLSLLALFFGYVLFDSRLRFSYQLEERFDLPVLADISNAAPGGARGWAVLNSGLQGVVLITMLVLYALLAVMYRLDLGLGEIGNVTIAGIKGLL